MGGELTIGGNNRYLEWRYRTYEWDARRRQIRLNVPKLGDHGRMSCRRQCAGAARHGAPLV